MTSTYTKLKIPLFFKKFTGISCLLFCTGFVLARAQLFSEVLPLGISFAVASFIHSKKMHASIAVFLSYLLVSDVSVGTRYATCVVVLLSLIYFLKLNHYIATACVMSVCSVLRLISSGLSAFSLAFCLIEISLAVLAIHLYIISLDNDHPQNSFATVFLVLSTAFSLTNLSLTLSLVFLGIFIAFNFKKIPQLLLIKTPTLPTTQPTDNTHLFSAQTKSIISEISSSILSTVDHVSPVTHDDVYKVYTNTCDTLCKSCQMFDNCWVSDHLYTLDCLNSATTKLVDKSHYKSTDFPIHFASKCQQFPQFLQSINSGLFDLVKSAEINKSIQDNKRAISQHYTAVSAVIDDISTAISKPIDRFPVLEQKIYKFVSKITTNSTVLAYNNSTGLLFVEIEFKYVCDSVFDHQKLAENLSEICGQPVIFINEFSQHNSLKFLFKQQDKFTLEICSHLQAKEQISGDIISHFTTNEGLFHVILSDGMGSGQSANSESIQVINLLENLLKAGVSVPKAVRTVAPICSIKNDALNFVALDLLTVDLNTLEASIIKYGASPTYISRDGKIYKISSKNLPLGLSSKAEISRFRLAKDDLVLISSDGLNTHNDAYIRNILRNGDGYSCTQIKELILQNEIATPDDDKSAIIIRITANN